METIIRNASVEEYETVAWIVTTALDIPFITDGMLSVCRDSDTIYSWEHARMAVVDGKVAGGLISYDGKDYSRMREKSWPVCWEDDDKEELDAIDQETKVGEYYLDSIAVLPEFRGYGIGKKLILDAIRIAKEKGFDTITCIADKNKINLIEYYKSIGFEPFGEMSFFGHGYLRMRISLKK